MGIAVVQQPHPGGPALGHPARALCAAKETLTAAPTALAPAVGTASLLRSNSSIKEMRERGRGWGPRPGAPQPEMGQREGCPARARTRESCRDPRALDPRPGLAPAEPDGSPCGSTPLQPSRSVGKPQPGQRGSGGRETLFFMRPGRRVPCSVLTSPAGTSLSRGHFQRLGETTELLFPGRGEAAPRPGPTWCPRGKRPGKRPHPPPVWGQESWRAPEAAFPANAPCALDSAASLWSVPGGLRVPAPDSPVVRLPASPTSVRTLEPQPGKPVPGMSTSYLPNMLLALPSTFQSQGKLKAPQGGRGAQHPNWRNPCGGPECCHGQGGRRGEARPESTAPVNCPPPRPDFPFAHWHWKMTDPRPGGQSPSLSATGQQSSLPRALPGGGGRASAPAHPLTRDGILTRTGLKPHRSAGMPLVCLCPTDLPAELSLPLCGPAEAGHSGRTSEGWARPESAQPQTRLLPDAPPGGGGPGGSPVRTPGWSSLAAQPAGPGGGGRSALPIPHPADAPGSRGATHRPGG